MIPTMTTIDTARRTTIQRQPSSAPHRNDAVYENALVAGVTAVES
jgi:hypothetical protein